MSVPKKLLIVSAVVALLVIAKVGLFVYHNYETTTKLPATSSTSTAPPKAIDSKEVFKLINDQRVANGLPALTDDPRLDASALAKCNDMVARNYVSHYDPKTGAAPWHFILDQGVLYKYAAENLAEGQKNAQDTVNQWMASPGHRENILNPNYTLVGTATCFSHDLVHEGQANISVQHFVGL